MVNDNIDVFDKLIFHLPHLLVFYTNKAKDFPEHYSLEAEIYDAQQTFDTR